MSDNAARIAANLDRVRERIAAASRQSGRAADAVKLVAVTKYVGVAEVELLVAAGCRELGESRPQELWHKAGELRQLSATWHLVGHLQRNKVQRTLPLVELVHSVDSQRLLAAIDRAAASLSLIQPILLEVNVCGEAGKHGLAPDEVAPLLETLPGHDHVRLKGLMCMAGLAGGPEAARGDFCRLRELRDELRANCPPEASLDELSMGMSRDFESAILEGATMVRIGTALFEGVIPALRSN